MSKNQYRTRNWAQYNKSLVGRGSLTFYLAEDVPEKWFSSDLSGERGRPKVYSDLAIQVLLHFKLIYRMTFRMTQGFADSLFQLMGLEVRSPSYSQFCRRMKTFPVTLSHTVTGPIHMVVDSTGLKLYGEGEWKRLIHGPGKHRMWRKLHLGVDERTQQIVAMKLTSNKTGDNKQLPHLLDMYEGDITTVSADKGYDGHVACNIIAERGAYPAVLPQRSAVLSENKKTLSARDKVVQEIEMTGKDAWKRNRGYHRRSLSETAMYRYKTIFGSKLSARLLSSQIVETTIRCNILNQFIQQCKPESYIV